MQSKKVVMMQTRIEDVTPDRERNAHKINFMRSLVKNKTEIDSETILLINA